MFRKIHSNRPPGETLGRALKNEFGAYLSRAERRVLLGLQQRPVATLVVMSLVILVSLGLSFTLPRKVNGNTASVPKGDSGRIRRCATSPARDGLDQLLETATALQQTLALKKQVETLLAKPAFTAVDSAALERALTRLNALTQSMNPQP